MIEPIHSSLFYHEGRGPELKRIHWATNGRTLAGIDYFNPDDDHEAGPVKHVRFRGLQVVMITPEEVIGEHQLGDALSRFRPAAMFNRGRSEWLLSFDGHHLGACSHFQLLFYDELFDIICEAVECGLGSFPG